MRSHYLYTLSTAVLAILLFSFGRAYSQVSEQLDESIKYTSFYHNQMSGCITLDCILNDSIAVAFETDTGWTGIDILMDSLFFYQHFDVADFKLESVLISSNIYSQYYTGTIDIAVGNHKFTVHSIEVKNLNRDNKEVKSYGMIGYPLFHNKITLIDFEKRQMAFVDSVRLDGYEKINFLAERIEEQVGKKACPYYRFF